MDINQLVEVLRATLQPDQREQAEAQLNEVHKIIGFAPILLQVVMAEQVDMPVRQAGVIYLKNQVTQYWEEREAETPGAAVPFSIHEQDKVAIRENIVEAVIQAPLQVRVQLSVCISQMVKHDYPGRWPGIAEKVAMYMQSDKAETWLGATICLYQLIKNFEYKKPEERGTLNEAMRVLLPLIHQRCMQLLPDQTEASVLIQKQILKCFYALIQYFLPLDLIDKQTFTQWMELLRQIADRPIPEESLQVDEEDRPELCWWKCKKWALHILARAFERYGSPGNTTKDYNDFADWYLKSFSAGILNVLLKILDQYRQKTYVSPRVLQQTLNYLNQGVSHALSWKVMKPHMPAITQEILFPLMCHSEEDQELWETDPVEYIRVKYDVFEEFFSPVTAAQGLLHSASSKRKECLSKTMGFLLQVLGTADLDPKKKAGALHMIGAMADILLQKKVYKDQMELFLANHVYPTFSSEHGYLRARACWVVHTLSEVKFKQDVSLAMALELTRNALCTDKELPVRVEAAIALQMLLSEQEKAKDLLRPNIRDIILQLLQVIRETENDDLTSVMQKLVCTYVEEITPLAVEITTHLAQTFAKVLENDQEGSDEKAIAAMGILNTLETIVTVMEDQKEILQHIEGIVLDVVGLILQQNLIEFYEELLSLVYSLTCTVISERMWRVFPMLYELFLNDNTDYFTDMMPALHNYCTVDPVTFMSNPKSLEIIFDMSKTVLCGDAGEDAECHAAKLLEVVLIQYKGQVDSVVKSFVELALERLTREVRTAELRTMCLQVVIAALYYNPPLLMEILQSIHIPNTQESVFGQFLKQWLHDCDCIFGLHDRKLSVIGLCTLMDTPPTRTAALNDNAAQIMPAMLLLFSGLQRAYASRAEGGDSDDEEGDDDEDFEEEEIDDEEDVIDDEGSEYIEKLEKSGVEGDSDDEYGDDDEAEETALESYQTPLDSEECTIDEYQIFMTVIRNIEASDPAWFAALTGHLTAPQKKELEQVFTLAEQRKAAAESKEIEKQGGYQFQHAVPKTFDFSSP